MYFIVFVLFHNAQWLIHRLNQSKYVQTVSRWRQKHTSEYWRCTAKKDRFVLKCREPCRATRFMSRRTFTCILLNYQPAIFAIKIIKSYFVFGLVICGRDKVLVGILFVWCADIDWIGVVILVLIMFRTKIEIAWNSCSYLVDLILQKRMSDTEASNELFLTK